MSDAKPEPVKVRCPSCSKKLGFPPQALGRKAKCPACAHVFKVAATSVGVSAVPGMSPAAKTARVIPPAPPPRADEDNSLLALAAVEESGQEIELTPEEAAKAQALAAATAEAHRAALAGTVAPPSIPERSRATGRGRAAVRDSGAGVDRMPSAIGMLAKGCLFCAIGALIGSFIWYVVARALGLELGYAAWALGLLAGCGMQLGIRAKSEVAGVIAAAMAVAGIFVGRVMVIAWVIFPAVIKEAEAAQAKMETSYKYQTEIMVEVEYEKILKSRNLDPEEAGEAPLQLAKSDAESRVKGWGVKKLGEEFAKYKASQPSEKLTLGDLPTGPLAVLFAVFSFSIFDILFVILATVSAFVIGSGRTFGAGTR